MSPISTGTYAKVHALDQESTAMEADLQRVSAGDPDAVRRFVREVTPLFFQVVRSVRHKGPGRSASLSDEDLVQEILLSLIKSRFRCLSLYRPGAGGCSLRRFLWCYARFRLLEILRRGHGQPFEEPVDDDRLQRFLDEEQDLGKWLDERGLLGDFWERAQKACSEEELRLFELSFVQELPTEQVCAALHLSSAALYQRRSRLRDKLIALIDEIRL